MASHVVDNLNHVATYESNIWLTLQSSADKERNSVQRQGVLT